MKILEAINALKLYYKTHNREDVEITGTLTHPTTSGGEVVLSADPSGIVATPKSEVKDTRSRPGVNFTSEQEEKIRQIPVDDPKMGRDKSGDGK